MVRCLLQASREIPHAGRAEQMGDGDAADPETEATIAIGTMGTMGTKATGLTLIAHPVACLPAT